MKAGDVVFCEGEKHAVYPMEGELAKVDHPLYGKTRLSINIFYTTLKDLR